MWAAFRISGSSKNIPHTPPFFSLFSRQSACQQGTGAVICGTSYVTTSLVPTARMCSGSFVSQYYELGDNEVMSYMERKRFAAKVREKLCCSNRNINTTIITDYSISYYPG